MKSLILIICLLQTVFAAPQLISFKDGKVGVNFLGYHAEAGLGGGAGQTGGLLGGLHASAGTPWGQNAAAGLGGNVNGRAAGMLYAGAQATPDVGASAVLGGDTSQGGFSGSDAYANGKVTSHTKTITSAGNQQQQRQQKYAGAALPPQPVTESVNAIQKIRPPKKYYPSEGYEYINTDNYNNGIALHSNKTKNVYDIEQQKPAAAAAIAAPPTIVITKTINKTTISTPFQNTAIGAAKNHNSTEIQNMLATYVEVATTAQSPTTFSIQQSLINDADNLDNTNYHHHNHSNQHNDNYNLHNSTTFYIEKATSLSSLQPTIISSDSSVSLSHLNDEENNSNGNNVAAATASDNGKSTIIITSDRKRLRDRPQHVYRNHHHHHQRHHYPRRQQLTNKRIHSNRQRQVTKTIVKALEQEKQATPAQNNQAEELSQIYHQHQQHHVRRQLIAPAPAYPSLPPAHPCDLSKPECANVNTNANGQVRSEVVQNALQIPIGILQSLQNSFGNFRAAPPKGY